MKAMTPPQAQGSFLPESNIPPMYSSKRISNPKEMPNAIFLVGEKRIPITMIISKKGISQPRTDAKFRTR